MPVDRDADNEKLAKSPTLATPPRGVPVAVADTAHPDSDPNATARDSAPSLPGFRITGLIGRGGMGEVMCGNDIEIGRDVAIKRLRGAQASPEAVTRFLREAKIQARLEHPGIIPVHSIGRDSEGEPYFTMKRITGVTLAEQIATGATPRQRLLRAFVDICNTIDFAHGKRVVHRDLKPSNIMLGDYREVYVLDWGLARVLDTPRDAAQQSGPNDVITLDGSTQAGAVLGTPGYMAPEQMEDAHAVDTAADIYALGSILFEILADETLHKRGEVLTSTLTGTNISPAKRRPDRDIPPELDALCVAALARLPAKRPTARELADRIEGFLDGDRDLEARNRIVALELTAARKALASGDSKRRADAMQSAGRALALDPKSRPAADLVTSLMLEPPKEEPEALREQLLASEVAVQRKQGKVALGSFASNLVFFGAAAFNGVTDWALFGSLLALTVLLGWTALVVSRRAMTSREILFLTVVNAVFVAVMSRMFSSLLLAPAITCIMALSFVSYPQNIDRARTVMIILIASWLGPIFLEWAGVLERTWWITEGEIVTRSSMFHVGGIPTLLLIVFANVFTILVLGQFANKLAASRRDAQRQVQTQAWHLQQLLPKAS